MFKRRLGPDPHADGAKTAAADGCPDIWELKDGDFAVIGISLPKSVKDGLPSTASCGPDETVIRLPRRTLVLAKPDIPDST